jgi:hypothetical protein
MLSPFDMILSVFWLAILVTGVMFRGKASGGRSKVLSHVQGL